MFSKKYIFAIPPLSELYPICSVYILSSVFVRKKDDLDDGHELRY